MTSPGHEPHLISEEDLARQLAVEETEANEAPASEGHTYKSVEVSIPTEEKTRASQSLKSYK